MNETSKPKTTLSTRSPGAVKGAGHTAELEYCIQKHAATRLHYDFRLELDGVLKSWAIPKGPSLDPGLKRLAVHVEDHALGYVDFEGSIAPGNYGAGDVVLWDRGTWKPLADPVKGYAAGKLTFELQGVKLEGTWSLVKTSLPGKQEQWLLIKGEDDCARKADEYDIVQAQPGSVL